MRYYQIVVAVEDDDIDRVAELLDVVIEESPLIKGACAGQVPTRNGADLNEV